MELGVGWDEKRVVFLIPVMNERVRIELFDVVSEWGLRMHCSWMGVMGGCICRVVWDLNSSHLGFRILSRVLTFTSCHILCTRLQIHIHLFQIEPRCVSHRNEPVCSRKKINSFPLTANDAGMSSWRCGCKMMHVKT